MTTDFVLAQYDFSMQKELIRRLSKGTKTHKRRR